MTSKLPQNNSSFKPLSSKKLLLYITLLVCIFTATAVSIIQLNNIVIGGSDYKNIKNSTDAIENVVQINSNLHQIINEVRPIMHDADKGTAITVARLLTIDIDKRFVNLQELIKTPGRREAVVKADTIWKEYKKTLLEEIVPAAGKGDKLKIAYLTTGIQTQRYNSLNKTTASLTSNLRQDIAGLEQRAVSDKTIKIAAMALLTCIALSLIVYFSLILSNSFNKSLQPSIKHLKELSDGNLGTLLPACGSGKSAELHDSINLMTGRIRRTVSGISSIGDELSGISEHLGKTSSENLNRATALHNLPGLIETLGKSSESIAADLQNLSRHTSENSTAAAQLSSTCREIAPKTELIENRVQQISSAASEIDSSCSQLSQSLSDLQLIADSTSASIQQFNAAIRQVETSALNTSVITEALMQDVENGRQAAEETISGIKVIKDSSRHTSEVVESLVTRVIVIENIISSIHEVAEQTNLLALNANIIASQSGEYGKGFAVVVDEIRELSERTDNFSSDTSAVIHGIQQDIRRATDAIKQTEEDIHNGEQLSRRAGMALNQIVSSIQQAGTQVREIAETTTGQTKKSRTFNESIESMSTLAKQTARISDEQARTCQFINTFNGELLELAADLRSLSFKQGSTSETINRLSEEITGLVENLKEAEDLQMSCSDTLVKNVSDLDSTTSAISTAETLEINVKGLNRQIELLRNEISGYKL